jgi:uracil-DNA glycosylase
MGERAGRRATFSGGASYWRFAAVAAQYLQELQRDLGASPPKFPVPAAVWSTGPLHGILLLNACLTVEEGKAPDPCRQGRRMLTDSSHQVSAERSCRAVHALGRACMAAVLIDGR